MKFRRLGKTGLEVSVIAFGGIPIQESGRKEARELVGLALDCKINFFDTAQGYGDSELKIGEGIKGRREECLWLPNLPVVAFNKPLRMWMLL